MSENYRAKYQSKVKSAIEALSAVKDGDYILLGNGPSGPLEVLSHFHELKGKVKGVTLYDCCGSGDFPFLSPDYKDTVTIESAFYAGIGRKAQSYGAARYVPVDISMEVSRWAMSRPLNVFIGACTLPDENGKISIGCQNAMEIECIRYADYVILEANPNVPWSYGDTIIDIDDVDAFVETDHALPSVPRMKQTEIDKMIGANAASLVKDGDCIQLGIGGMSEAVADQLKSRHDLGVHTEMINSCIYDLVMCGAINNSKKTLHKDKMISVFALGDEQLYRFLDHNKDVEFYPASYVNNPTTIAKNDNFVSINSTMAVDLLGQCASETIGMRQYSGSGGQFDTAYGALRSKGGRSIIMTPSTRKNGEVSCIVPFHAPGTAITMLRNTIDYVVTEFGVAELKGKDVRTRMKNLIAVAHPDHRDELRFAAEKYII